MPKKTIVRAPNWLGDAVMSTPFLKRLIASAPGPVDVLCKPAVADIYRAVPGLGSVLEMGKGEGLLSLARRLRAGRYEAGYVLPPSFSSALLFFLAGIPERIGYAADFRSLLLTKALPLDERYHYVRRYLGLIGEEGREVSAGDFSFPNETPSVSFKTPILAIAPGSRAPARRWFPERFAELVNGLSEKDWPSICLLGAPDDAPHALEVERLCRRTVSNLCGKTTLAGLGELLKKCAVLVTNESGLMHAAWAAGTPTVVLAGPSEPRVTSPFGARVRILQHREIPCVPCVKNDCYRLEHDYKACLKALTVDEVRNALNSVQTL